MKRGIYLLFLMAFLAPYALFAQSNVTVKGNVVDQATKETLIGVTVKIVGGTGGTITDFDGNYNLANVPSNAEITFSYVGLKTVTVPVNGRETINIVMESLQTDLKEVVVVGYGTQKSKDLTAPIVNIRGEELSKQMTANPLQALQGKLPGVQITNSGAPGSSPNVKIRGVGSIGDYAKPLYVVDGVFVDDINFLSNSDIDDITVLKDASAAAIYGVRAANGVMLITTKRGKTDKPIVTYDGYAGFQNPVNIMKLANKEQYVTLLNEANQNTTGYVPKDPSAYPTSTDWYGELVHKALIQNHSIDVSGRTGNSNYSFGMNYFYQDGIMDVKNDYERFNLRGRFENDVTDWLKLSFSTVVSQSNANKTNTDAFFQAFINPPVYSVYDEANSAAYPIKFGSAQMYGFGNSYGNPVAMAYYAQGLDRDNKVLFAPSIDIKLSKNLVFKSTYNLDFGITNSQMFSPEFFVGGSQGLSKSKLSKTFSIGSKQIIDNLLTYNKENGKHRYSLMVGQSTRIEQSNFLTGEAIGVPGIDKQSIFLSLGSFRDRYTTDGASTYHGLSYFTRGTYSYDSKYMATLTFRADGSSKYQDKWGYFPSIGLGWNISEEGFLKKSDIFQQLKLRASWGMLGNDNVPANSAVVLGSSGMGSSGVFGDQVVDGVGAQTVLQSYLKWEVVKEFDFGVDFKILNNKLSGELDYYNRETNNVVFYAPIASGGGKADLLTNNGSVRNSGFELKLNWNDKVTKEFSYNVGLNLSTINNKVTKLDGRDFIPGAYVNGDFTTRTQVGHSIGSFYGYEIAGVYKTEGEALSDPVYQTIKDKGYFKYKDQNGDNVIDEKDKVFLGSPIPSLVGGLDFGCNWGAFDASISFQGQFGNKILNAKRMSRGVFSDGNYDLDFYENRWTSADKSSTYPSAEAYNSSFVQQANDFFVENGSYLRVQNIQLGYTFSPSKLISKVRVYVSAQQPFTYFTYKGFTPEVGGSPIATGIDNSTYPMQSTFTLGARINF